MRRETNCNARGELMRRISELDFIINETVLYLDVYPRCRKALEYYRRACMEREKVVGEYESKYGPLTVCGGCGNGGCGNGGCGNGGCETDEWQWISDPWPWQYDAN